MYVVEKKITGWIVLQYKIIVTKYLNIAFPSNRSMCTKVVVNNGGCITSHNKRGEQAFIQNILENNYRFR